MWSKQGFLGDRRVKITTSEQRSLCESIRFKASPTSHGLQPSHVIEQAVYCWSYCAESLSYRLRGFRVGLSRQHGTISPTNGPRTHNARNIAWKELALECAVVYEPMIRVSMSAGGTRRTCTSTHESSSCSLAGHRRWPPRCCLAGLVAREARKLVPAPTRSSNTLLHVLAECP